jgi:Ni/Co efflux regulator RcnB
MRKLLIAASLALAAFAVAPAGAAAPQSLPQAEQLDKLPAEFTRHNREHRHWEIQRNMERRHFRHGRGYDRGYGYRRHGGPPPWAPAHGYRRHHGYRY